MSDKTTSGHVEKVVTGPAFRLRKLRNSAFLSIAAGGLGLQMLNLVSGPLVARMLGPDGRGEMAIVTVISLLCSQLGMGGLPAAIAHSVGAAKAPARDALRGHIRLWLVFSLVPSVVAAGFTVVFVGDSSWLVHLTFASFLITLFASWRFLLAGMLLGEGNARHVNATNLSGAVAYVSVVVAIFLVHRTEDAMVVLFIYAGAQAIGLAVGWHRLQRPTGDLAVQTPRSVIHGFARRTFFSGVSALDGLGLDVLVVALLLGQASLGLYAVAVSVTNLPVMVLGSIAFILLPRMAALSVADRIRMFRRWFLAAVVLDIAIVLCVQAVIAPVVRLAFGAEFVPMTTCARILSVAWGFLALRRVLAAAVQAQGRTSMTSMVEAVCAVILVVGVAVGGHFYGIEGAGLAMMLAGFVSCVWLAMLVSWRPVETADAKAL